MSRLSLKTPRVYLLFLFIITTLLTYGNLIVDVDSRLWSLAFLGTNSFGILMSDILGTFLWPVLIIILALWSGNHRRIALALLVSLLIAQALEMSFSEFLPRDGPLKVESLDSGEHLEGSYPSGHTARAFAAATVLFVSLAGKERWLFPVLALGSGLSRLLLGVHFFSDVVGGALLGMWAGTIGLSLISDRFQFRPRKDKE